MKLEVAFLADYASVLPDGRWNIVGGRISEIPVTAFPAAYPSLYLGLSFAFLPEEADRVHQVQVSATDPRGTSLLQPVRLELKPQQAATGHRVQVAFRLTGVTFPEPGIYKFAILSPEGGELGALRISLSSPGPAPPAPSQTDDELNRGFQAFVQGDPGLSERIFETLVADNPELGAAHNNLGFVRMARGAWQQALESLQVAARMGFGRVELLEVNLGCCEYQLGQLDESLRRFQHCLSTHSFLGQAVLFALGDSVRTVVLLSAADYAALVALNAGWSALGLHNHALAGRYLSLASAADLANADEARPGAAEFRAAVSELTAQLEARREG